LQYIARMARSFNNYCKLLASSNKYLLLLIAIIAIAIYFSLGQLPLPSPCPHPCRPHPHPLPCRHPCALALVPSSAFAHVCPCHCCHQQQRPPPPFTVSCAATAIVVFVDGSCRQRRWWWDGRAMTQWHWQQWLLHLMVVVAMAVVVLNCPAVVDVAAIIPSLALTAAAKMPLLPPPLAATSIGNDCYHSRQQQPLPLPHS
jgi:hypothetical protein